jgi:autotransporter passenger strand-loop-strand repeat protein
MGGSMSTISVGSGVVSSGLTISAGETLDVLSGGTVSGIIVSGGYENVAAGGVDSGATVENGGTLDDYGSAYNTVILNGGAVGVGNGSNGFITRATVGTGGTLNIYADGTGSSGTVSGGVENVYGGLTGYDSVESGGAIGVTTGGFSDEIIFVNINNGGSVNVYPNAYLSFANLNSGGVIHSGVSAHLSNITSAGGTVSPLCFAAGTRIQTDRGLVTVEDLAVGEPVKAHFAGAAPIIWIGKRTIDCQRHARPESVYPVRVRSGAFGEGVPFRDVMLSPDHAVFAGGVLVPVRELINGTSIAQVPVDEVTYYHVELRHHDVVWAEGLPAESYLDTGNRANFAGGAGVIALHPEFAAQVWDAEACAPLVLAGRELEAVKRLVVDVGADCIEERRRAASH